MNANRIKEGSVLVVELQPEIIPSLNLLNSQKTALLHTIESCMENRYGWYTEKDLDDLINCRVAKELEIDVLISQVILSSLGRKCFNMWRNGILNCLFDKDSNTLRAFKKEVKSCGL